MPKKGTQQFLEIDQIREGVLVLKDRSLRGVLLISSINFALKSTEEQTVIIRQFQDFLNSLDFSCQIVVQSRRLNITGYLDALKDLEEKQQNELLKIQTQSYREFIEEMIKGGTIMKKTFLVVVPFFLPPLESKDQEQPSTSKQRPTLTETAFQRHKFQLWQRMEFVALGLKRCGLQTAPLITPELIELLWALHHPKEAEFGYYPEIPPGLSQ
jgi:type IV secretory pathway VirB4 component